MDRKTSTTRVIAFANQKGGVGKTTTAVNLAAYLAALGEDMLIIDLDPQANATSALGIEKQPGHSVYATLLDESTLQEEIIGTLVKRLDLIPSELDLAGAEVDIARSAHYLHCFQKALEPLLAANHYDYIFIDCPPSLGILTSNALTAAHAMIIPVQCEYLALEGLSMITRMIEQLRAGGANPGLTLDGIVMTMFDGRTRLSLQVIEEVKKHFGERVYATAIPRTIRLSEAPSFGQPIMLYDPRCTGALAYRALAKEFLRRHRVEMQNAECRMQKEDGDNRAPDKEDAGRQTPRDAGQAPDLSHAARDAGVPCDLSGEALAKQGPEKTPENREQTPEAGHQTPEGGHQSLDVGGPAPDNENLKSRATRDKSETCPASGGVSDQASPERFAQASPQSRATRDKSAIRSDPVPPPVPGAGV